MKEDKPSVKSPAGKEDEPVLENGKKKSKEEKPLTKIVVRRLPPTMTEEQFKNQVSPLPEIDYFYFVQADMSLMPNAFCRAYINFVDQADLFVFTQKFDGYVFVDSKGGEYPAVVEFAPFQRIPKNRPNRKKDPKMGTIELTPAYIAFKERLEAESLENKTAVNSSKQHFFETSLVPEKKELVNTPLLDYVKQKRADRQKAREEKREEKRKRDLDRKKAKEEQRRIKKEEDSTVVKISSDSLNLNTPVHPDPSVDKTCIKDDIVEEEIDFKNKQESSLSSSSAIQDVEVNIREMFNFFNKSIKDFKYKKPEINIHMTNKACLEHKTLESEMIRNANVIKTKSLDDQNNGLSQSSQLYNFPVSSHFNESNNNSPSFNVIPKILSKEKMLIPCLSKMRNQPMSNIPIKPVRIEPSSCQSIKKENKISVREDNISTRDDSFSSDAFRKKLQKVVDDVLGNTKLKSPKQNEIYKPKTFIQRASCGSGEQCLKSGYNFPCFYLPPRAFGCGTVEPQHVKSKPHSYNKQESMLPRPVQSFTSTKGNFPAICKKPLQFSKKPMMFFAKSDGDFEQSPMKRILHQRLIDNKLTYMRRPCVAPKKYLIVQDSN